MKSKMPFLNHITDRTTAILFWITFGILISCTKTPEISENTEGNEDKYINSYITWGDPPFWIDSLDRYSVQKMDSLDLNQLLWNNKKLNSIYSEVFDGKINNLEKEITVLTNSNDSKEFEIDLSKGELIYKLDTISKWEIKKFKQEFKDSYNWRNLSQTGYQGRLDFENDSVYDALSFRLNNNEKLILHFVLGKPKTLHYIFELNEF